jgi:hypothetical protein
VGSKDANLLGPDPQELQIHEASNAFANACSNEAQCSGILPDRYVASNAFANGGSTGIQLDCQRRFYEAP